VVSVWSLFTAWTGAVNGYISLLLVRFFFGIAEAGAFPGSARAIMNWLPPEERGRANGALFSGSRLGAALAFPLLAWMLARWRWRVSFGILGLAGMVWAICWLLLFRNHPAAAKTQDRRVESGKDSLGKLLGSRPALLAMAQYLAGNFTFFICLSWMLPYLKEHYRLSDADAAGYAMIPLLFAAGSQWISGFLVDRLYGSRFRSWSRRIPAASGFFLATAGLLALTTAESPFAAVACFTLAAFGADMSISPSWSYCMDVGKKNAGSLSGAMNMVGNLGSFISANAFPFLLGWTGSANSYFYLAALLNLMAIGCWLAMKPQAEEAAGKSHG
jgi:ACS family glucarate transporter-like MFS transporter